MSVYTCQGHGDGTHDMGVIQSLYLRLFAKLCASRRRAEPALREGERRFRQAVEAAPNAMVMIGRAGEIVMVNAQPERAFGYARAELESPTRHLELGDYK